MIRVSIVANSPTRAHRIADLLAEDDGIEIVDSVAFADIVVAAGVPAEQVPADATVVFLADHEPVAFEAQGRGWLPVNVSAPELLAAIVAAAQNLTVLTPAQVERHLPGRSRNSYVSTTFVEPLTNRELQVLRMLANGLGNKEIAGRLGISDHTAKFHVAQILAKLGAGSRTEAVTIAIRRGLVPI